MARTPVYGRTSGSGSGSGDLFTSATTPRTSTGGGRINSTTALPPPAADPNLMDPAQRAQYIAAGWRVVQGVWVAPATTTTGTTTSSTTTTRPPDDYNPSDFDTAATPTSVSSSSGSTAPAATPTYTATTMPTQSFQNTDYLNGLLPGGAELAGSTSGAYSDQYTANMLNDVMTNPDVFARAVLTQMGMNPGSGYGATISNDLQALSPIAAYVMANSGYADSAGTANYIGGLAQARATAGGGGQIGADILGEVLDPNSQAAMQMLGLGTGAIGDLPYDQQINAVNALLGAGATLGLNPWMGAAYGRSLNQASTAFTDQYARDPTAGAQNYVDFMRQQGYGNMFR